MRKLLKTQLVFQIWGICLALLYLGVFIKAQQSNLLYFSVLWITIVYAPILLILIFAIVSIQDRLYNYLISLTGLSVFRIGVLIVVVTLFILFALYWTSLENGSVSWLVDGNLFLNSHKYIGGAERAFIVFYLITSANVYWRKRHSISLS